VTAVQILVALLILTCGPVLLWRRRDNVLGYMGAGLFVSAYLIPLVPTLRDHRFEPHLIRLYADVLSVGAIAFLVGLALGGQIGARSPNAVPLTFSRPVTGRLFDLVATRARWITVAGIGGLLLAFLLMRYVPLLASDRVSAKYGVGSYRLAFERGSLFYRFGLAACSAILPVMLAVFWRRRRLVDLLLCGLVVAGLALSLSRTAAFAGPLIFATAVAVERNYRPMVITALLVGTVAFGTLVSLAFLETGNERPKDAASRIAASSPDVRDHLGFLRGYERRPEPTYGRTLLAGLTLGKSTWDPSTYALRTITGLSDLRDFASGGLRLPAPLWGYASFGWAGALMFPALSGVFAGWGVVKLKRLLTSSLGAPGAVLNLAIAVTFYEGTFGALSEFFFLISSVVVAAGVAVVIGVAVRVAVVRPARRGVGGRGLPPPAPVLAGPR
jgi:MFS family permease